MHRGTIEVIGGHKNVDSKICARAVIRTHLLTWSFRNAAGNAACGCC